MNLKNNYHEYNQNTLPLRSTFGRCRRASNGKPRICDPARQYPVNNYQTNRPETSKRLFVSQEVERQIDHIKQLLTNAKLAWMFENCFPNTLDTTVHFDGKEDTFVYTGDIHAMWLRDSGAQVWPYVQLANKDPELKRCWQESSTASLNVSISTRTPTPST